MSKGQVELLAYGISQIGEGNGHPLPEKALRAQHVVDEHLEVGDITQPERNYLRFLIAKVLRMNQKTAR